MSEDWLPKVGCAIVTISSDRPLSENDLDLIRELMDYTPRVVLLLSKADLLSEEQQHQVVSFFKATLKKELNKDFQTLTYSTIKDTQLYKRFWINCSFHYRQTAMLSFAEYLIIRCVLLPECVFPIWTLL